VISIVIICRDETAYIEPCLDSIAAAASGVPCEIVIVDGGSRDDTIAHCRSWASRSPVTLRVVESAPGYARQRNAGVRAARYPWIAFISADVRVPPSWLREIAAATDSDAGVMIGSFDLVPDGDRGAWMAPLARTIYPPVCGSDIERCSTVNLVARRELLLACPFDPAIDACEDKEFAVRALAGHRAIRLWIRPSHLARESFAQWLRKLFREARAMSRLSRRRGDFPDCFGWRAHARHPFVLLHAPLEERRPLLHDPKLAALHIVSMLSITAGVLAGSLTEEAA